MVTKREGFHDVIAQNESRLITNLFLEEVRYSYGPSSTFRSSRWQMFFKIGVLKNFVNFAGKHLCLCLFLIKLQVLGLHLY